jgi:nucleotide-binding universal stress UspA family protein
MASAPALARNTLAIKSILFATDLSYASDSAATYVRLLAANYGSTVYAVHVLPHETDHEMASWHWQFARASLQSFLENHGLRRFPHKVVVGAGRVAERLSTFADDIAADLIVVGTHGRAGVNKFVLGSIAEQVFRTSKCPVLTVGPHVKPRDTFQTSFNTVLVATDFTDSCANALAYGAAMAEQNNGRLVVLNAVDESGLAIAGYVEEVIPKTEMRVRKWVHAHLSAVNVPWLALARFGHTADVLLRNAVQHRADLLVMGARASEHPGVTTHSFAATAYKVVSRADCPVLTVHARTE